ncbi:hypothetical protein GCM10011507_26910 [Edaphobacter acidisoli]|uniref:Outer membrane lipoprotein-sorting protein n=1 Tax=Edaphobacter acidisoli TaxID=2040573 RepID=A0A916W745_9BACT|nr:hypothetical protein [Edaphobacter acidisoli]GGA74162.1 hypothetical protein GCM10011507_26910 [Edaphobacter acidisoli]
MKSVAVRIAIVLSALSMTFASVQTLRAQADAIPSASPAQPVGQSDEQRGKQLIDEMVKALGGQAWLDRQDETEDGRVASFFQGQPNGLGTLFHADRQFPGPGRPEALRIGFLSWRGMIMPGKKTDVVQIWRDKTGYEITYKGKTTLPKEQVANFYLRRDHSIEVVVRDWIKAPGVMIVAEGTTMVERRMADKVTVLSANNDAVTLELDATTHLPLRSTFRSRNAQFNDWDEDVEEYDDYHTVQDLPTAYTLTRYHNGEMVGQTFLTSVKYNTGLSQDLFNPDLLLKKK